MSISRRSISRRSANRVWRNGLRRGAVLFLAVALALAVPWPAPLTPTVGATATDPDTTFIEGTIHDDNGSPVMTKVEWGFWDPATSTLSHDLGMYVWSDASGYYHSPPFFSQALLDNGMMIKVWVQDPGQPDWVQDGLWFPPVGSSLVVDFNVTYYGNVDVALVDETGAAAPAGVPVWFTYVFPGNSSNFPWDCPADGVNSEHLTDGSGIIHLRMDASYNIDGSIFLGGYKYAFPAGRAEYGLLQQTAEVRYEGTNGSDFSTMEVPVWAGTTQSQTLTARALSKITVNAKDAGSGAAVAQASFNWSVGAGELQRYATFDNGVLTVYARGTLGVTANDPDSPADDYLGHEPATVTVTTTPWQPETLDAEMQPHLPGTIQGRVVDVNGDPLVGSTIELQYTVGGGEMPVVDQTVRTTTSAADGTFSFTQVVPAIDQGYIVKASKLGLETVAFSDVFVDQDQTVPLGDIVLAPDSDPPTWVGGLSADGIGRTSLVLSWHAAQDNVGVTGYRLYKAGELLADLSGDTLGYQVTGLTPGTSYDFQVQAGDALDNWSADGPTLTETTLAAFAPGAAIQRVSVSGDGIEADSASEGAKISGNGQFVAFSSSASNLVEGDSNWADDIFAFAAQSGQVRRVSARADGTEADSSSTLPSISDDGRYVTFASYATNLADGDTNGSSDVFVYDLVENTIRRVSVATDGTQGDGYSDRPVISADGRYVAFDSNASNLTANDTNGSTDVFLRDLLTGQTELVSVRADGGGPSNGQSNLYDMNADASVIIFTSSGTNFGPADDNGGTWDIYIRDRNAPGGPTVERIAWSFNPSISADGRYVAFESSRTDIVPGDTNGQTDIFVYDRQAQTYERVSLAPDGTQANSYSFTPSLSADGRYVAFISAASNLVAGDTNGLIDVFVHDRQTGTNVRVNVAADGTQASSGWCDDATPSISGDGRYVAFMSDAYNLVPMDDNRADDIFLADLLANPADTARPTWPGAAAVTFTNLTETSLTVNWTAAEDNVGVANYRLYRDGVVYGTLPAGASNLTVSGLTVAITYAFRVEAGDAAGNWSDTGPTASVTTPDLTAPTWPGGSSLTASEPTATGVTLTWTAATDNVGVTGYRVYQNDTVIGTTAELTFTAGGLTPETDYTFRVEAGDAADNWSATGPTASVKTAAAPVTPIDSEAPTWGAGAVLTTSGVSQTSLTLSWPEATDGVGVTAYRVYRGATIVATTADRTHEVTGLSAGTEYTFKVEAGDAAGNWSADGPQKTVETASPPPPPPAPEPPAPPAPTPEPPKPEASGPKTIDPDTGGSASDEAGELTVAVPPKATEDTIGLMVTKVEPPDEPVAGGTILQTYKVTAEAPSGESVTSFAQQLTLEFHVDPASLAGLTGGTPGEGTSGGTGGTPGEGTSGGTTGGTGGGAGPISGGGETSANVGLAQVADRLYVVYWDETLEAWIPLPTEVDPVTGTVTALTDHLTLYAVMYLNDLKKFSDIGGDKHAKDILKLASLNVINGFDDGTFRPDETVTREQFAKMVVLAAGLKPQADGVIDFIDATGIGEWAAGYVATAVNGGIIKGLGDGRFGPTQTITRAQVATIIARALRLDSATLTAKAVTAFADDSAIPEWARDAISLAADQGVLEQTAGADFGPDVQVTRGEIARMLSRLLDLRAMSRAH